MSLLDFARGPALQWSMTSSSSACCGGCSGCSCCAPGRTSPSRAIRAAWKGLRLIALRSWPRREFLEGTAFGEVMGYAFHVGFLVSLFFFAPHVLFFADVARGLIGTDLRGLIGVGWPTLPNGIVTLLECGVDRGARWPCWSTAWSTR